MKIKQIIKEAIKLPPGALDHAVQYISGPMLPKPGGQYRLQDVLKRVKEIKDAIARAKQSGRLDVNSAGYKDAVAEIKKWADWLEASQAPAQPGTPTVTIGEASVDQIRQNIAAQMSNAERQRAEQQAQRAEQDKQRAEQQRLQQAQRAEQDRQEQEAKSRLRMIAQQAIVSNDRTEWNKLSPRDKAKALLDAGLIDFGDQFDYSRNAGLSDQRLQQAILQNQQNQYDVEIGPEKRAELQAKAEELAEIRRQQLQKEKLERERLAYERYKDDADRAAAMKKIEMEYKHDLDMLNTEHRNNMEAIRTGNAHEINKMNMDYAEAARERQHELEKEKMRQQQQAQRERPQRPQRPRPEPEDTDDEDEEPGEPFRPQAPAGPGLAAPTKPPKPSKYDTGEVTDVDFTEKPRPPKPGQPPQLPKPANEMIERLKQLAGR